MNDNEVINGQSLIVIFFNVDVVVTGIISSKPIESSSFNDDNVTFLSLSNPLNCIEFNPLNEFVIFKFWTYLNVLKSKAVVSLDRRLTALQLVIWTLARFLHGLVEGSPIVCK